MWIESCRSPKCAPGPGRYHKQFITFQHLIQDSINYKFQLKNLILLNLILSIQANNTTDNVSHYIITDYSYKTDLTDYNLTHQLCFCLKLCLHVRTKKMKCGNRETPELSLAFLLPLTSYTIKHSTIEPQ